MKVCLVLVVALVCCAQLVCSLSIPAKSSQIIYSNGRYHTQGEQILFDWSGFTMTTRLNYVQDGSAASLPVVVQLKESKNHYNANVWLINDQQQRLTLLNSIEIVPATARDAKNGGYSIQFKWEKQASSSYNIEIEIEKKTEASLGIISFSGFVISRGDQLIKVLNPIAPSTTFKMEFIGDSISCGYGNMKVAPCHFSADTENVHESFTQKTARKLNATTSHVQCWSGRGMVRNFGDKSTVSKDPLPLFYGRTLANDATKQWDFSMVPDVVVISLGTNDFSTPPRPSLEEFSAGYQKLLDLINSKYLTKNPNLKIVLVKLHLGNIQYVKEIAEKQVNYGKSVFYYDLSKTMGALKPNEWGCDGHPYVTGDEKMAIALSSFIKETVLAKQQTSSVLSDNSEDME